MKIITIRTYQSTKFGTSATPDGNIVTVLVKSFYDRAQFWIGLMLALSSLLGIIYQYYPSASKVGLIAGILGSIATFFQTELSSQSLETSQTSQTPQTSQIDTATASASVLQDLPKGKVFHNGGRTMGL